MSTMENNTGKIVTPDYSKMYRYFGLKFGRLNWTVRMDSAELGKDGGHAAVWAGVGVPDSWVQGGICVIENGKPPMAYIETKVNNMPGQYHCQFFPMDGFGIPMKVQCRRSLKNRKVWTVTIIWGNTVHKSIPVRVFQQQPDACLELFMPSHAICHINGHKVEGREK